MLTALSYLTLGLCAAFIVISDARIPMRHWRAISLAKFELRDWILVSGLVQIVVVLYMPITITSLCLQLSLVIASIATSSLFKQLNRKASGHSVPSGPREEHAP